MTTRVRTEPEGLGDLQAFGLDLTVDPDTTKSTMVHEWDAAAGRRVERWVRESPRVAHAKGRTVAPRYPATTATIDLDAPETPVDGVPKRWADAERAARLLGLTVIAAPSGSESHGVKAMTGIVPTPSVEHAQGFLLLVQAFTRVSGLVRVGCHNRILGGWRDKPSHSPVYGLGGVLVRGGAWEPRTTDELRRIAATGSHVPTAQVAALLAVHGAHRPVTGPVPIPDGDGTIEEMRQVLRACRARDGRNLLEVAATNGAGYDPGDPASRHQGEGAVIAALVRHGYGVQAVERFFAAHEIGERMRAERRASGRLEVRTPSAQTKHVRRAVANAAALIVRTGGYVRSALVDEDTLEVLTAAWAVPCSFEARAAFAVLATVAERAGRAQVELAQLDLELLTGMDGCDAVEALRAHPCVDEVVPGRRDGTPTAWRITAPRRMASGRADRHAPGWEAVVEAAGSAVVAGGGVGRTYRAHTALVLATIRDIALKPGEIAVAIGSTPERVGRVLKRLAEAELTERLDGARHRVAVPLWLGAMATGTAEHPERKAGKVADRRARRKEDLEGLHDDHGRRGVVLAGDPGIASSVVDELPVVAAGDPLADLVAAYVGDPGMDGAGPVHPGLLALAEHTLDAAGGDLDVAAAWMTDAGVAVWEWTAAHADEVVPAPLALGVALQVVAPLPAGWALDADARAAVAAAGEARAARIDWPTAAVPDLPETAAAPVQVQRAAALIRPWSDPDAVQDDGSDPLAVVEPAAWWEDAEALADAA